MMASLLTGFRNGLLSVFKLERKVLFLFHSFSIWSLYLLTSYCVLMAFSQTASLGFGAVFTIFAIGSIAIVDVVSLIASSWTKVTGGGEGLNVKILPGGPEFMRSHGVEVIDLDDQECVSMMKAFIAVTLPFEA